MFANPSNFFIVKVQYSNAVMCFYALTHFARRKAVGVADLRLIQESLHVRERQTDIIV